MLKFSTYEELLENEGLKKKAAKSGISLGTLKKVYNRGMAAWKTGHRPGTTPQQWAHARVNSYITKGKGTYYGADSDLSGKGKKKEKKEGYVSMAQQRAVWANRKDGGKGHPDNKKKKKNESVDEAHNPKHVKQAIGVASDKRYAGGNMTGAVKVINKIAPGLSNHPQVKAVLRKQNEHNELMNGINEISKNLTRRYVNKAAIDLYHKGHSQGTADTIDRAGGKHPDQEYKGGPEFKGARRVGGIQRATRKLMKKEADDYHYATGERIKKKPVKKEAMSDAEKAAHQKAIDAFKAKGGKVKKLKPGYADGYHGKADPAAGMKGMMDKGDTKFMSKKKVRSMR